VEEQTEASTTSAVGPPSTTAAEATTQLVPSPEYVGDRPFALGVASGDPDANSVVLWTRLRIDTNEPGPFAERDFEVALDVARDEAFGELVHSDYVDARLEFDHSIHAIVGNLDADAWFWYRFRIGEYTSTVARTRTLPASGYTPLRFGFSSCQNWESGSYAAHRHLADEDLDLFIWLGDYIYEYGPGSRGVVGSTGVREHNSPEVADLAGYRQRYALYKSDPALQAHHAARPWLITWDDHEVENNYAGLVAEDDQDEETFRIRRQAAQRAWWENMPVRLEPPAGDRYDIYRTISWGELADIHMLDGRQYRDPTPTDGEPVALPGFGDLSVRTLGETARNPDHSMLGAKQRAWLEQQVDGSDARWNVLGNQVYMHGLNAFPGKVPTTNTDTWDGYHGEREALLLNLTREARNLIVLTGDFHSSTVADLRADPYDSRGSIVATEFMAPAISSAFPNALRALAPLMLALNPQVHHFDPDNGYMTCEVTESTWTTRLHRLADVTAESSAIAEVARFTVNDGTPGIATVEITE